MIFRIRHKNTYPLVESLPEPCFLFSSNGKFRYANKMGRIMLKSFSDQEPCHADFLKMMHIHPGMSSEKIHIANGIAYKVSSGIFEGDMMIRLISMQEDEDGMQRMRSALNVIPWGIITVDFENMDNPSVVFCNEKAAALLDIPRGNMIGQPIRDILRVSGMAVDMDGALKGDEASQHDHEVRRDGRIFWYRFDFIPYGKIRKQCLIVISDTTDNKIMEGQYFQAQRLESLGQLAGGVAHDFNNILSIIDGYARIAKKTVLDNPEAMSYLDRIAQSVQRGSALTSQLLTFGRHKVIKDSVIDLGQLVKDQEPLLRPLMDASVNFSMQVKDGAIVEVPPDNICQILLNLCVNSRDAMPDGGDLIIEASKENDRALLRVIDTGGGMTPEVKAKMFDPFFTTKDQGKGTGLGLSMVYGLVKDMKGEIDVISRVGSGTSITVSLPLSARKPEIQEIIEEAGGKIRMNGYTVMVAEDEPDLLNLLCGMLEDMGMKVLCASNGNEALMIQEDYDGEIDFLLTDVVMPELNGVKLAEMFESVRPRSKIMFMSGYPANGLMARVPLPEGAFLMAKPVDFKKLGNLLRKMTKSEGAGKHGWQEMASQWRSA